MGQEARTGRRKITKHGKKRLELQGARKNREKGEGGSRGGKKKREPQKGKKKKRFPQGVKTPRHRSNKAVKRPKTRATVKPEGSELKKANRKRVLCHGSRNDSICKTGGGE